MVHINPESKRFKSAVRFFTYGVMTMATLVISALVIALALGYRFTSHGDVVRDGLVQLSSHPIDAQYSYQLNGRTYSDSTPAKLTLRAGSYTFTLSQPGYRTWQKQLNVVAGHVHWINYPRLVPSSLTTSKMKSYPQVKFAVASPDKRWLLVNTAEKPKNRLLLIDLKDPKKPEVLPLTIPENQLTVKGKDLGGFAFSEWSLDSKMFLLRHSVGDTSEFLQVDRSKPQKAVNINRMFQLAVDDAHFSGNDNNVVYARTQGVLRRFDIAGNATTGALMRGVKDFDVYGGNTIIFDRINSDQEADQKDHRTQEVGLNVKGKEHILQELPANEKVLTRYNQYDHHSYLVVADHTKKVTTIYQDPTDSSPNHKVPFAQVDGVAPDHARFSGDGRFIVVQSGTHMGVYDFYEDQKFTYSIPGLDVDQPVKWLDNYHLQGVANGKLTIWDFDGTNKQTLVPAVSGLEPVLDEDNDVLYDFALHGKKAIDLTQTNMKTPKK